jgi:hypothetical protein
LRWCEGGLKTVGGVAAILDTVAFAPKH